MDLVELIKTAGYIGLFAVAFAESGLFFGFFLPGDSLLFTAGFLASQGFLDIGLATALVFLPQYQEIVWDKLSAEERGVLYLNRTYALDVMRSNF